MIFINPTFNSPVCNSLAGNGVISVTFKINFISYLLSVVYCTLIASDLNNQSVLYNLEKIRKIHPKYTWCF